MRRVVEGVVVERTMWLAVNAPMRQVRAISSAALSRTRDDLRDRSPSEPHAQSLPRDIQRFLDRPGEAVLDRSAPPVPPPEPRSVNRPWTGSGGWSHGALGWRMVEKDSGKLVDATEFEGSREFRRYEPVGGSSMRSNAEPCSNGGGSPRICGRSKDRRCRFARPRRRSVIKDIWG